MASLLCLVAGCSRARELPRDPGPPPEVAFVGCDDVSRGGVCGLTAKDRELSLWWADGEGSFLRLATDQGALAAAATAAETDGHRVVAQVPAGARWVELSLTRAGKVRPFKLGIEEVPPDPMTQRVRDLQSQGRGAEAIPALRAAADAASGPARAIALRRIARIELQVGNVDSAIASLRESIPLLLGAGKVLKAAQDHVVLAFALHARKNDYPGARAVVEAAAPLAREAPRVLPDLAIIAGQLARDTGDLRAALAEFRQAREWAARLRLAPAERQARRNLAMTLRMAGRELDALQILTDLIDEPVDNPCDPADRRLSLALNLIALERKRGREGRRLLSRAEPHELLAKAHELMDRCVDPHRRRNLLTERLLLAIDQEQPAEAQKLAGELRAQKGGDGPILTVWRLDAEARLALATRQPDGARRLFEQQLALASDIGLEEEQFRAQVGIGRALEAGKQQRQALAAYRLAEAHLERQVGRIPLAEGLFGYTRAHRESAGHLVDGLLRLGLRAEAMAAARRAHMRAVERAAQAYLVSGLGGERRQRWQATVSRYRQLRAEAEAANADWGVTAEVWRRRRRTDADRRLAIRRALDEALSILNEGRAQARTLRPPAPGELLLTYFPLASGWVGFAALGDRVVAARLETPDPRGDPATLAKVLLAPFTQQIGAARLVTFLLPAELWALDFPRLSWQGRPLVESLPLRFGLDLCGGDAPCAALAAAPDRAAALVVADPGRDLKGARDECDLAVGLLAKAGLATRSLQGKEATHARVVEQLGRVWFFHYAGHGVQGGSEGSDSVLPLAGRTRLFVDDILSLESGPGRVVLSACDGARIPEGDGGLSLAHAFVAAGASAALAATRPVADGTAWAMIKALYAGRLQAPDVDPASALRGAQLELAKDPGATEWAAFRVLVP